MSAAPTPENVASVIAASLDGDYEVSPHFWAQVKADGSVVEIAVTPYNEAGFQQADAKVRFRALVVEGAAPIAAFQEVVKLHRRAYSEPVKAILLEAPDHPHYEELPDTLEEREKLPARFHTPVWMGDSEPTAWLCAVCWDEGTATGWPCKTAAEHGGEVFAR